jgi:DNA-binding NarL/FixJ family response regulator
MALWTEAVVAVLQETERPEAAIRSAANYLALTGYVDALVAAARACPRLGGALPRFEHYLGSAVYSALPTLATSSEETSRLSSREREVARLIGAGLTNREIAAALVISEATVKVHVRHILDKLHARSRAEVGMRLVVRDVTQRHASPT